MLSYTTVVAVSLQLFGFVFWSPAISNMAGASFRACGERTIATDGCCQVDQSSIRCSPSCPDGYYPSQTVCDSTSGLTTAGAAETVTAAFSVWCCACSEVCYNCSAAGASSCYTCAEGHVYTADSPTSGRCTARVAGTAANNGLTTASLAVILFSVLIFVFAFLASLLLCFFWRRKQYRSERTKADRTRESSSRDTTLTGISSVQYNSSLPARPSPISPDFTDDGAENSSSVTLPSGFSSLTTSHSCVHRCVEDQTRCRQIIVLNGSWTTPSINSGLLGFSTSSCQTEHSEYSLGYWKHSENEIMSTMNTFRLYESCTSTQTDFSDQEDDDRPYFSDAWQIREEFTSQGGTLQSPLSDVRVQIPAAAIQEGMYVLLKGAICTDLDFVHRNLQLPDNEYIMSPVAEYSAAVQHGFRFQKPVRVVLPHFLRPSFSKGNVKVYQCRILESGDWTIETLPLEDKDNLLRRPSNQNGFPQPTGVFYLAANSEIHIWTSHFSVYFCTDCGTGYPPPELRVEVHAKHVAMDADQRQVDVRLDIWDSRLQIQDFRNQHYGRTSENFRGMVWIDTKNLPAQADSNLPLCQVKTSLELKANCARSWMHTTRGDDTLYPVESVLNLRDFIPCTCRQARIPQRVDWQLVDRPGNTPGDACGCYVDVGYVSGDGSYVTEPRKVTIDVNVRKCLEEDINKVGDANRLPSGPNNQRRRVYNNLNADDFSSETKPKQRLEQRASDYSDDSDELGAVGGRGTPSELNRHFSGVSIGSCGKVCVYYPSAINVAQTGSHVGQTAEPHQQRRTCPGTSGSNPMTQAETDTGSNRLSLPVANPVARDESGQRNAGRSSPVPSFLEQAETQRTSAAAGTSVGSLVAENTTGPSRSRACTLPAPIPATEPTS